MPSNRPFPRTGEEITHDLENLESTRAPIVEDFLHERTVFMLAADPGAGKSVISTQLALSLTTATPLFGLLHIPQPRKVYYLQLEGSYEESIERIRDMQTELKLDPALLAWDDCRGMDVGNLSVAKDLIQTIGRFWAPEVVIVDSLYKLVKGSLKEDTGAKAAIDFLDLLMATYNCAVFLNHHTHRTSYAKDGKKIEEEDPFYGSQWLKAHVDTGYLLRSMNVQRSQCALYCKKSRGGDVIKQVFLEYDPESHLCRAMNAETDGHKMSGEARVIEFLKGVKRNGRTTDFVEVMTTCELSRAHLRRIQLRLLKLGVIKCNKRLGRKRLWEPENC